MTKFIDEDFLLNCTHSREMYHCFAADLPIVDLHSHLSPVAIAEDRPFDNLIDVWLDGDHYKWRAMRQCGVSEEYCTGKIPAFEKFLQWASTLERLFGNPLYHWSHLELYRFFGVAEPLTRANADRVWAHCNRILYEGFRPSSILSAVKADALTTTDDPVDNLESHRKIAGRPDQTTRVLPCWRPDSILAVDSFHFPDSIKALSLSSRIDISNLKDLREALIIRLDWFSENMCVSADHAIDSCCYVNMTESQLDLVFRTALAGGCVSEIEQHGYKTALLSFLARQYTIRGWTQHYHIGAKRNVNTRMFNAVGPDGGFDAVGCARNVWHIGRLIDFLDSENCLPRTVLYCLNPAEYSEVLSLAGCFPRVGNGGHVQLGPAWWFNDHLDGITDQLKIFSQFGALGTCFGMVTDSRSFVSLSRHEYFRRVLCRLLGEWVSNGLIPNDKDLLHNLISDICYRNALSYLSLQDQS